MQSEDEKRAIRARKISRLIKQWEAAVQYAIQTSRKQLGVSQAMLAERMGWSHDMISNVEKGRREISVAEFIVLAEQIGIAPETLFKRITKV